MSDDGGGGVLVGDGTTSLGVPTNADAVPSRAASPVPPKGAAAAAASAAASASKVGGASLDRPPSSAAKVKAEGASGSGAGGNGTTTSGASAIKTPRKPKSTYIPHPRPAFPEPGSTLGTTFVSHSAALPTFASDNKHEVGRYFTLGRLGRGTFCSIHKCVDLGYCHTLASASASAFKSEHDEKHASIGQRRRTRIVAAKVELSTFANSGVLDGEATVLKHLSKFMPEDMIPGYFGYVKDIDEVAAAAAGAGAGGGGGGGAVLVGVGASGVPLQASPPQQQQAGGGNPINPNPGITSAIIMEYLPGEDMHRLRDRHCNVQTVAAQSRARSIAKRLQQATAAAGDVTITKVKTNLPSPNATRRLCANDAVYLAADVMLPLIKAMHSVGCIHRDVKPSNCVRTGTTSDDRSFKLVDFGLSKSFVVPVSSSAAAATTTTVKEEEGEDETKTKEEKKMMIWDGIWDQPEDTDVKGCLRTERPQADFRGTSMYASLRVHQGRDYCRRDDVWGLLYVFCDLISGGLPWMNYALERNRDMCRKIKEVVHGERTSVDDEDDKAADEKIKKEQDGKDKTTDQIALLLLGADHHTTKYKRDQYLKNYKAKNPDADAPDEEQLPTVAPPLPIASDEKKVGLLRKAFDHVANLDFYDTPDYDLLGDCLRGFLEDKKDAANLVDEDKVDPFAQADIVPIQWSHSASDAEALRRKREAKKKGESLGDMDDIDHEEVAARKRRYLPTFNVLGTDAFDPLESEVVLEADRDRKAAQEVALAAAEAAEKAGDMAAAKEAAAAALPPPMSAEAEDLSRLPLDLQLKLAQVEYNARNPDTIPPHLALRDWMDLVKPLLYQKWDASKYERGNHRTADDNYKREGLLRLIGRCLEAAKPFGYFTKNKDCFYYPSETAGAAVKTEGNAATGGPARKKRKIEVARPRSGMSSGGKPRATTPRLELSRAFSGLRGIVELEKDRKFAPPPKISFLG